ncbi:hypothetical protein NPIL_365091 [Nephila pilipes]|uniref:Uncharacterized protein n=1 Tax=Nephila pilipes TaxID=299642 RepID=A0A8X6UPW9_NEPPI|nr:hypothetical protein NPIL_365091 [Nephila pilipes]
MILIRRYVPYPDCRNSKPWSVRILGERAEYTQTPSRRRTSSSAERTEDLKPLARAGSQEREIENRHCSDQIG